MISETREEAGRNTMFSVNSHSILGVGVGFAMGYDEDHFSRFRIAVAFLGSFTLILSPRKVGPPKMDEQAANDLFMIDARPRREKDK